MDKNPERSNLPMQTLANKIIHVVTGRSFSWGLPTRIHRTQTTCGERETCYPVTQWARRSKIFVEETVGVVIGWIPDAADSSVHSLANLR